MSECAAHLKKCPVAATRTGAQLVPNWCTNWSPRGFCPPKTPSCTSKVIYQLPYALGQLLAVSEWCHSANGRLFFLRTSWGPVVRNGKRSPRWDTFRGGPHILFGFSRKDIVTTNSCKTTGPNSAAVPNYSSSKCYGYLYIYIYLVYVLRSGPNP